jgi:hypothetical protein
MKKSVAIILIVVFVLLCTCPTLFFGVGAISGSGSPEIMATAYTAGQQFTGITPSTAPDFATLAVTLRGTAACAICLGILIPLVVGFVTLRMARKHAAAAIPPQ